MSSDFEFVRVLLPFFFRSPAPAEIYTLSLHDALPISASESPRIRNSGDPSGLNSTATERFVSFPTNTAPRSEEHTSELQSQSNLVCRLLLEKKKKKKKEKKLTKTNNTPSID